MTDSTATLAHDVIFGLMSESPDLAAELGLDDIDGEALPAGRLPDFSVEGVHRRNAMVRGWRDRLVAAPREQEGAGDAVTRQVLQYVLTEGIQSRFVGVDGQIHADHIEPLTHQSGVHAVAMHLLVSEPADGSRERLAQWLDHLAALPETLATATETLRQRRLAGYVAPEMVLQRAVSDIRRQLGEANAFTGALLARQRRIADEFGASRWDAAQDIVTRWLPPAYAALADELDNHLACGRQDISTLSRKGGDAFYAWRLAAIAATRISPDEAHRAGLEEIERLDGEFRDAFDTLGLSGSRSECFAALAAQNAYPEGAEGRAAVEQDLRRWVHDAREATRPLFRLWPRADVDVEIIAPEDEPSEHSNYRVPSLNRRGRGAFRANLAHVVAAGKAEAPIVCFHETWPGHHVQLALAQEAELCTFRRAVLFRSFLEGWAKYAELVPEQVGLGNPRMKVARLRTELYSTATLAMDTGVHHLGWTAEQARDFFIRVTAAPAALAHMVVLRSAANPGELCAYKIGMLKFRELQSRFAGRGAFDVRDFHDAALRNGALPFAVLDGILAGTGNRA